MYKTGVFAGKFMPPHRGHINSIIDSATQCETLYVVVSDHPQLTERLCKESNVPIMDGILRTKWLSQELQGFEHIKVVLLDETGIPEFPYGWELWSEKLKELIPTHIDALFGGEQEYKDVNNKWFPTSDYILYDYSRERYPISATLVRNEPYKYWDYILGNARPFFAKKVLITGTESCGKTTITKYLAKIFHTSWSEEIGRYYSAEYLGGNESVFKTEDFGRISYLQYENDMKALRTANRIVFYDTDAVVTQYYSLLYTDQPCELVESFVDPSRYDAVLLYKPDVTWVDDGLRFTSEQKERERLHNFLKIMYKNRGFKDIVEISGDYNERLRQTISIVDELLTR
jgi:HTH-type transcriptional repressor of NAD biosynthesis genes